MIFLTVRGRFVTYHVPVSLGFFVVVVLNQVATQTLFRTLKSPGSLHYNFFLFFLNFLIINWFNQIWICIWSYHRPSHSLSFALQEWILMERKNFLEILFSMALGNFIDILKQCGISCSKSAAPRFGINCQCHLARPAICKIYMRNP